MFIHLSGMAYIHLFQLAGLNKHLSYMLIS